MSDQPNTCPKCGTRTQLLRELEIDGEPAFEEQCLNPSCMQITTFVEDDDVET